MRKKKRANLVRELIRRREEVIKRARMIANKQIPEHIIEGDYAGIIEWIVKPHINEKYEEYKSPDDEEVRWWQKIGYKIAKILEKGEKTEED